MAKPAVPPRPVMLRVTLLRTAPVLLFTRNNCELPGSTIHRLPELSKVIAERSFAPGTAPITAPAPVTGLILKMEREVLSSV